MFTMVTEATLTPAHRLTPDQVTDLIAVIIDELDASVADPDISTYASDDGTVRFTVTISVEGPDEYQARAHGAVALRDAFGKAGLVADPKESQALVGTI